jgi:hypothetical protein
MSSCRRAFVPSEARAFVPALAPKCGGLFVGLTTSAKPPHIPDMIRIASAPAAYAAWDRPSAAPFWRRVGMGLAAETTGRTVGLEPAYI